MSRYSKLLVAALCATLIAPALARADVSRGPKVRDGLAAATHVTGVVRGVDVHLGAATTGARLVVGVYADRAGRVGRRLTSAVADTVRGGGWNQVEIRATRLRAHRRYWVEARVEQGRIVLLQVRVVRRLEPAPEAKSPAVVSGQAVVGDPLSSSAGSWSGDPTSFEYAWTLCDSVGDDCRFIPGSWGSTFTPVAADAGHRLRSVVIAVNPAGSSVAESAPSASIVPAIGAGVRLVPIDGGPTYFASKDAGSAWLDDHILLGGWLLQPEDLQQVENDAAMGLNLYWSLAGQPGTDDPVADYDVIREGGMHVIAPSWDATSGSETVGFEGVDEADVTYGAGAGSWEDDGSSTGCVDADDPCGYTVANFFYSGASSGVEGASAPDYPIGTRIINNGFGKGVLFWDTDAEAAQFLDYSDILSADSYWMTDPALQAPSQGGCALLPDSPTACGDGSGSGLTAAQADLPANYGWNVTRLRQLESLDGGSKPIVADVETGCPFSSAPGAGNCTTPPAAIASAWHALIAGARGIIWFQHNFSGPCFDDHTFADGMDPSSSLYDCQQTPGVTLHDLDVAITGFDDEVTGLNGVLLSPTADGYVSSTGDVSTMAKVYGDACYVFAGSGEPATPPAANQKVTFRVADDYSGPVTVYGEDRTVQATDGEFADTFANADSVHIYVIPGPGC